MEDPRRINHNEVKLCFQAFFVASCSALTPTKSSGIWPPLLPRSGRQAEPKARNQQDFTNIRMLSPSLALAVAHGAPPLGFFDASWRCLAEALGQASRIEIQSNYLERRPSDYRAPGGSKHPRELAGLVHLLDETLHGRFLGQEYLSSLREWGVPETVPYRTCAFFQRQLTLIAKRREVGPEPCSWSWPA